eukprot:6117452-Amphidinium_carterae.2
MRDMRKKEHETLCLWEKQRSPSQGLILEFAPLWRKSISSVYCPVLRCSKIAIAGGVVANPCAFPGYEAEEPDSWIGVGSATDCERAVRKELQEESSFGLTHSNFFWCALALSSLS